MGERPLAAWAAALAIALGSPALRAEPTAGAAPPVSLELWESHATIDAAGKVSIDTHDVYRLLVGSPGPWYGTVSRQWKPWRETPPVLEASVTRPDGTVVKLDPATISDQVTTSSDGLTYGDRKRRIAPLPGLTVGALVERRANSTRSPDFVDGNDELFTMTWDVPVKKRIITVDVPAGAPFHWKVVGDAPKIKPRRQERDGHAVWTFEAEMPAGRPPAPFAPRDASQLPTLYVSTIRSWQTLAAAWAARADARIDGEEARQLATQIVKDLTDRDAKAKAILSWMAANLRYTGVELGAADLTPARTREVLDRRYGDCKDLSLLLVALLRASGVDADLALVSVSYGRGPTPEVPGLAAFDHAIVRLGSGPTVWLDPTGPFEAYGEAAALAGRLALVARPDTIGLVPIQTSVGSSFEGAADVYLADDGPARLRAVSRSDGFYFADARELAARKPADYRSYEEQFVREVWRSERPPQIDSADPFAPGPFRETFDVPDANIGTTKGPEARAFLYTDKVGSAFQLLRELDKHGVLAQRSEPVELFSTVHGRAVTTIHPPDGFRAVELPEDYQASLGPVKLSVRAARRDHLIDLVLELDVARGNLAAEDARKILHDVLPALDRFAVDFKDGIAEDIDQGKRFSAVESARATVAAHPTPANRARLAAALGSAGLVEAAAREAHRALAEAPEDRRTRDRAAFALTFNARGDSLGRGMARAEVLAITAATIAKYPDDEWARRLHILAERSAASANLDALARELNDYRSRTGASLLDGELISVRLEQRGWKELAAECPKLAASPQREAACLAADLALGASQAWSRLGAESATTLRDVGLDLMLAREYDVLLKMGSREANQTQATLPLAVLKSLRRSTIPAGDRKEPILQLMQAAIEDRLADVKPWLDPPELLTPEERRDARVPLRALRSLPGRPWQIAALLTDVLMSAASADVQPLEGFGEQVTLRFGLARDTKVTVLVRRTAKGYRLAMHDFGAIAAEALRVAASRPERAAELYRVLRDLLGDRDLGVTAAKLDAPQTAPFAAAVLAVRDPRTRAAGLTWLDAELERPGLGSDVLPIMETAYWEGLRDDPARLEATGRRLEARDGEVARLGVHLEIDALFVRGSFAEARERLKVEIAKNPGDRRLATLATAVGPALGEFTQYRQSAAFRLLGLTGRDAAWLLNNLAWYSIYGGPDAAARSQAERAVEIDPRASYLNTLAAVYVGLGLWNEAVLAFQREQAAEDDDLDDAHDKSYYWVRGRLAEALGEPAIAAAMYRKIERTKNGTADDVYLLAAPRLQALGAAKP